MKIVGLTGSIASGKSTVSKMLRARRVPVICADRLARDVVKPGLAAYQKIIKTFSKSVLQKNKRLNRQKLAGLIFQNAKLRAKLNAIVHPAVMRELRKEIRDYKKAGRKLVALDIPLLFETGMDKLCDLTIVVYASESQMRKRLMVRDELLLKEAQKRIASQLSIEQKKKMADLVIDNSGSLKKTRQQVAAFLDKLQN